MKVWKYKLESRQNYLHLPTGYEILSVQCQGFDLVLWAKVDPEMALEAVPVIVVDTGESLPKGNFTHISTLQNDGLVRHIFKRNVNYLDGETDA